MPHVDGTRIRHRLAELDRDLAWLAEMTDIPEGTLRNATREDQPQPVKLRRIYRIAGALGLVHDDIAAKDGVPDKPPEQPDKGPKGPPKRETGDKTGKTGRGPGRAAGEVVNEAAVA